MPITALMLAEPPQVQQMPVPETYQEAREALYVTGNTLFETIQGQPPQTSNAELTTAEVISGIGEGLALVAQNSAKEQGKPERGDIQFSLNVGGALQIAFSESEYAPDSDVCYATERLRHAAYWWLTRAEVSSSSSTKQLISQYHVTRQAWASGRGNEELQRAIEEAAVSLSGELFDLQGGGELFTELTFAWRGAESCFEAARRSIQEGR